MPDPTWLNSAELAERLRTTESTVRFWRHTGYGPPGTLFGRRVLYRLSDVIEWEREHERTQAAVQS